jgi:hypothetical protein
LTRQSAAFAEPDTAASTDKASKLARMVLMIIPLLLRGCYPDISVLAASAKRGSHAAVNARDGAIARLEGGA